MAWSIETDDFLNNCGLGKFPLLTSINSGLNVKTTTLAATTKTTSSTQAPLLTTVGASAFICPNTAGIFADPSNCRGFIMCDASRKSYKISCSAGLVYDPAIQACNWPESTNVQCDTTVTVLTTITTLTTSSTTSTKPITSSTPSTATPITSTQSTSIYKCYKAGMFPDPVNCHGYIVCDSSLNKFLMACPAGLVFDPVNSICNWPYNTNVKCV
jgi:hypothetical protein